MTCEAIQQPYAPRSHSGLIHIRHAHWIVGICPGHVRENFFRNAQLRTARSALSQIVLPLVCSDSEWSRGKVIAVDPADLCNNIIEGSACSIILGQYGNLVQLKETIRPSSIEAHDFLIILD
jgi:hypothetical protein